MSNLSPARQAAFRILLEVERGQAHSDDLLRARFVNRLAPVDRNLATALVLGTLRWQVRLDHEIKQHLAKPNAKLDAEVRLALRLGALQLLHMERIPAHAAIAESVELAKLAGHSFAARMVNAVLRKLAPAAAPSNKDTALSGISQRAENPASGHDFSRSEQRRTLPMKGTGFSPYIQDPQHASGASAPAGAAELALTFAHPAWLVERWIAQYGVEQTQHLCIHGQQQPALHLRLADAATEDELRTEGIQLAPATLLMSARTLVGGDLARTAAFRAGRVRIQDEGSQLVAELAAACAPQKIKKICDACAAPGGKTLILAECHSAAQIVACELSAPRAEELTKRLASLSPRVTVRSIDAAALPAENFDLILVDAPCSGTGTLGRNPEIRHRLQPEEFARQAARQLAILSAALGAVRPGGRVLYSTCSLEREENDEVVAAALAANSSVHQLSLAPVLDALNAQGVLANGAAEQLQPALTPQGALRLLPGALPTDGFFVALFERAN
jgi:16S rRNA (cytosine967-C5)-methyltransferase